MIFRFAFPLAALVFSALTASTPSGAKAAEQENVRDGAVSVLEKFVRSVIAESCLDCHSGNEAKGNLDLSSLPWNPRDAVNRQRWILAHDRISKGEMPPDSTSLSENDRQNLLKKLSLALHQADRADVLKNGRGPMRRLTRREYEQNLRDLLKLPHLDIRDILPADREKHRSSKVAEVLDISRVQLDAWLTASDFALRQAVASGIKPRKAVHRHFPATRMFQEANTFGGREAMFYARNSRMIDMSGPALNQLRKEGKHDPDVEVAIFRSASWPYYGYPEGFTAAEPGEYRVRFSARAVRQVRDFRLVTARDPIPMTFRARKRSGPDVSGDVRATGGVMDIRPKAAVYETTIRLKKNETFEYSLLGLPVPRAINPDNGPLYYDFPPMPDGGHPGVAFQWLELVGPIDSEEWPPPSHQVLFDDLPIRPASGGALAVELVSKSPEADAARLLRRFLKLAARQPVSKEVVAVYEQLVMEELEAGTPLAEALLSGYVAFLCSGEFVYLAEPMIDTETPKGHHFAAASRLSHFLGNTRPDTTLIESAVRKEMLDAETLKKQTDRLIDARPFERFVEDFTDHWLSLKDLRKDEPDVRLYPEYRFDDYLIESMEAETRAFFLAMIRENLPVVALVDTDFVFVNDRLARHYDLPAVVGSRVRRVELPDGSPFGGLMTQAAVMKVTANGTTTSPVVRGAWVMERIMGDPPPPPPASVPAIEPDVRGATTVRQLLASHTKDPSCRNCHARFDPVGFALENFDILGAWRNRYRSLNAGVRVTGIDRAGHDFAYHVGVSVSAGGKLLNGREFQDVRELKALLKENPRQMARGLLHQLVVYSTGTPIRFSDRAEVEKILDRTGQDGYRIRDLIHALVQSRIFLGSQP